MDVGAVVAEAMEGIDGRASVSSGTLPDGQSALQPAEPSGSGASPSSMDPDAGEMTERLKSRSMDELKTFLRAKKMKLSGTKTDLIARLVSNAIGVDEGASAKGASRLNQTQLNMIKVRWPFQWLCCSLCTTNSSRSAPTVITQVAEHRKDLNAHVRTLAKMVDDDWHDGWEEQGHELQVSVKSLQDFLDHA